MIRRRNFDRYEVDDWNDARCLPPGFAAVIAFFLSFGVIIPSMSQVWYTGPIANAGTGDIGILTGFAVSGGMYLILRTWELRRFQDHSS